MSWPEAACGITFLIGFFGFLCVLASRSDLAPYDDVYDDDTSRPTRTNPSQSLRGEDQ